MMPAQEPLDVIILATDNCPCGLNHDAFVDMLIYRTARYGLYVKTEIVCDISDKTFLLLPAFIEQE